MAYTWKYRVDLGKISAGVFIRTRIFGASTTPDMVRRIPHKIPKATVVWMAFLQLLLLSCAKIPGYNNAGSHCHSLEKSYQQKGKAAG